MPVDEMMGWVQIMIHVDKSACPCLSRTDEGSEMEKHSACCSENQAARQGE